jgi:hypothetical protein
MATGGTGYTNLHSFTGGTNDGLYPYGDVTLAGSTLNGMTYGGGTSNYGVVFSISLGSISPGAFSPVNPACFGTNFAFSFQTVTHATMRFFRVREP